MPGVTADGLVAEREPATGRADRFGALEAGLLGSGVRPLGTGLQSCPMKVMKLIATAVAAVAAPVVLAAPSHADVDTDFANQLHTVGIYGPRDYNAWLGKIACKRLWTGLDGDAYASAAFLHKNLPRGTDQGQALQFLGFAIAAYCPEQIGVLQRASVQ